MTYPLACRIRTESTTNLLIHPHPHHTHSIFCLLRLLSAPAQYGVFCVFDAIHRSNPMACLERYRGVSPDVGIQSNRYGQQMGRVFYPFGGVCAISSGHHYHDPGLRRVNKTLTHLLTIYTFLSLRYIHSYTLIISHHLITTLSGLCWYGPI